jgi:hypothetical protein
MRRTASGAGQSPWRQSLERDGVADDERTGEVRPFDISCEAGEQVLRIGHGVGGAKGSGQGQHARAAHTPDTKFGVKQYLKSSVVG